MKSNVLMFDSKTDPANRKYEHGLVVGLDAPIECVQAWDTFCKKLKNADPNAHYSAIVIHTTDVWHQWEDHNKGACQLAELLMVTLPDAPVIFFTGGGPPDSCYRTELYQKGYQGPVRLCDLSEFLSIAEHFLRTGDIKAFDVPVIEITLAALTALQTFTWQWERTISARGGQDAEALRETTEALPTFDCSDDAQDIGSTVTQYVASVIANNQQREPIAFHLASNWGYWLHKIDAHLSQQPGQEPSSEGPIAGGGLVRSLDRLASNTCLDGWYSEFRNLSRLWLAGPIA